MRHLVRACVAVAIAAVIAIAGHTPAEASRSAVADRAGDAAVPQGCALGVQAVDVRQLAATTYAAGGTWHLRSALTLAALPQPARGQRQTFTWTVSTGSGAAQRITVTRTVRDGRLRLLAAPTGGGGVGAAIRGRTVVVRGVDLPTGRDVRVSGSVAVTTPGSPGCTVVDGTRATEPLPTYSS